jgi:hypothetical protein
LGPGNAQLDDYRKLVDLIADVPGDIVECGVGNGTSLFTLGLLTEDGRPRRLWGFDSFGEKLPPPQPEDEPDGASAPASRKAKARRKIEAKKTARSESHLRALVLGYRLHSRGRISRRQLRKRFVLVRGLSPAGFREYAGGPIALLHLNLQRYQACKDCLQYFEPKLAPGGVVAFDQYRRPRAIGVTRAIDEYYEGPPPGIRRGEHWKGWVWVKPGPEAGPASG